MPRLASGATTARRPVVTRGRPGSPRWLYGRFPEPNNKIRPGSLRRNGRSVVKAICDADQRSECDYPKALVVVGGNLVDEVNLPGKVLAHRIFAPSAAFARREDNVFRFARHVVCPGFER